MSGNRTAGAALVADQKGVCVMTKSAPEILAEETSRVITDPVALERWRIVAEYVAELEAMRSAVLDQLRYEISGGEL